MFYEGPPSANGMPVTLRRSQLQLTHTANTLLESAEAAGARPAYGCRMGICNTCVCPKSQGSTTNLLDGSTQHDATQALKICVSSARSDLTLDL